VGILITVQMVGAMLSNALWGKLGSLGRYRLVAILSISMKLAAVVLAFFAHSLAAYGRIFFLFGAAGDGSRIASSNLILILAPEAKRPLYVAVQMNIVSLGMFFSILGGLLLHLGGYGLLYGVTTVMLLVSLLLGFRLTDNTANR
jgi:MFS family permease